MTNFEKHKKEIFDIVEDSNLYASIYDLKCLMKHKELKDDEFLETFLCWLEKEN